MVAISATGLSLSFKDRPILEDVTFSLNEGDKLGIIGVNGVGKTTLFRLLLSELTPDAGQIYLAKDKTVGYLAQNAALTSRTSEETPLDVMYGAFSELFALEDKIEKLEAELQTAAAVNDQPTIGRLSGELDAALRRYRDGGGETARARCRSMLLRMGFTEEESGRPLSTLSGGQSTRLVLCRLLISEPDILFLDEPTNHLDADALAWLEDFLRSYKKTVLLISHDRYFLDRVTNKTLKISRAHARLFNGNYSTARLREAEEEASQTRQYREQQKEIARIEANIAFQRKCGMAHNFVTIRSKQKQLERIRRVEQVAAPEKNIRLAFQSEDSANEVLTVKDLCFSYTDNAPLIDGLSFAVRRGERVLFLGDNGCGKSTLIRLLLGQLAKKSGRIEFGYHVSIGYFDQENRRFTEENTVLEELHSTYPAMKNEELRSALARFLFRAEDIEKRVSELSGGERARLALCKLILRKVNLLVLDEPTNHLDIGSREALEDALADYPGTILAVSHDRYFIDRLATRIIELTPAGAVDYPLSETENPYAAYLALRAARQPAAATDDPKRDTRETRREDYEARRREQARKRSDEKKIEQAKKRAAHLEERLAEIEKELFGAAASDYVRAAALDEEKQKAEEELLGLYELLL